MWEQNPPELSGIAVEFTCRGRTSRETGRLLGAAAMVVETSRQEPLQAEAELRFRPRPGSPHMLARGVVAAHLGDSGLRVQFTELPGEHRRHILELFYAAEADRRTSKRVSLVTQIRTAVDGETLVGYTRDISAGGLFIETESPPPRGTEVKLRFRLTEDSAILESRAVVVYTIEREGMGLRFLELPVDVRRAIVAFVGG